MAEPKDTQSGTPYYGKTLSGTIAKASGLRPEPPKPWADLGVEEKIERLREAIMGLRMFSSWHGSALNRIDGEIAKLGDHRHDASGGVMIPFHERSPIYGGEKSASPFDPLA